MDPSCRYDRLVTIERFDSHFQLAGGVNLPKVLSCIGSDGKRRRQLVKVSFSRLFLLIYCCVFVLLVMYLCAICEKLCRCACSGVPLVTNCCRACSAFCDKLLASFPGLPR